MKQPTDNQTMELPMLGAKRGRGRPATGAAMTSAERQKAYRDRVRKNEKPKQPVGLETDVIELQDKLNDALRVIAHLEREQALLISERAAAFKAMNQAREELASLRDGNDTTSQLAADVLRLEEEKRQLIEDKAIIAAQGAGLLVKVRELEERLRKRAVRKPKV